MSWGRALAAATQLGHLAHIAALGLALSMVARMPRSGARAGGGLT